MNSEALNALKRVKILFGNSPYNKELDIIEDNLNRLEKFIQLCLTKYVPLDSLSPSFWESKKEWLEEMSYGYYLYLCEEWCEYVVEANRKLTEKEFELIYEFLKELL